MSDQLISADIFRMVHRTIQDITVGDAVILAYEEEYNYLNSYWIGLGPVNLYIINEQLGKYLQFTNIKRELDQNGQIIYNRIWCRNTENLAFIYTEEGTLHIIDLKTIEEIRSYTDVENCYSVNNEAILGIQFKHNIILYSVINNEEIDTVTSYILGNHQVCSMYNLSNDLIVMSNGIDTNIYSLKRHKMIYEDKNLIAIEEINNSKDVIFYALDNNRGEQWVIIFNTIKHKEIYNTNCNADYRILNEESILLKLPDKILLYSTIKRKIEQEIEVSETRCWGDDAYGKVLSTISYGKVWMTINRDINEIKIFNNDTDMLVVENENSYFDLIAIDIKTKDDDSFGSFNLDFGSDIRLEYLYKNNYYIHNDKIFTLEEFLEHLTIKEITPKYNKNGTVGYYNVVNSKGLIGKLSSEFDKLRFKDVLHNKNILTDRFEYIKKKYLV